MDNKYCEYPIPMPEVKTKAEVKRISRDKMFMEIARIVALRGTCDRAQVGAVLVDPNNNIVAIGSATRRQASASSSLSKSASRPACP